MPDAGLAGSALPVPWGVMKAARARVERKALLLLALMTAGMLALQAICMGTLLSRPRHRLYVPDTTLVRPLAESKGARP